MQFSESWLRTMADPKLNSEELSHLLTMSGLEVEEVEAVAPEALDRVLRQHLRHVPSPRAARRLIYLLDATVPARPGACQSARGVAPLRASRRMRAALQA